MKTCISPHHLLVFHADLNMEFMGCKRGGVFLFEDFSMPLNVTQRIVLRVKEMERQELEPLGTSCCPFFFYLNGMPLM